MDNQMIAMEAQAELMQQMMTVCREQTLKRNHSSQDVSATEKQ